MSELLIFSSTHAYSCLHVSGEVLQNAPGKQHTKLPLGFQGRILADIGASDGRRLHPAGYCFQERGFPAAVFTDKEGQRVCEIQTFQGSDTGNVVGKPCREFLFVQADRAQIDQRSSLFSWKSSSTKFGVSYQEKNLLS